MCFLSPKLKKGCTRATVSIVLPHWSEQFVALGKRFRVLQSLKKHGSLLDIVKLLTVQLLKFRYPFLLCKRRLQLTQKLRNLLRRKRGWNRSFFPTSNFNELNCSYCANDPICSALVGTGRWGLARVLPHVRGNWEKLHGGILKKLNTLG